MKRRGPMPHDAVWLSIRLLRRFTLGQVMRDSDVKRSTASDYIKALVAAGYVKTTGSRVARQRLIGGGSRPTHRREATYELARDVGVDAPRFGDTGRGREQLWRTMKTMQEFTCRDLAIHATTEDVKVTLKSARLYVHYLLKAQYLAVVSAGAGGREAVYHLVRNTGGKAPAMERDGSGGRRVFDPNLGRVVSPEPRQ